MGKSKKLFLGATVLTLCIGLVVRIAIPRIVQRKIQKWGQENGFEIETMGISIKMGEISLEGIRINKIKGKLLGEASFQNARIKIKTNLSVESIEFKNGIMKVEGEWRKEDQEKKVSTSDYKNITIENTDIEWANWNGRDGRLESIRTKVGLNKGEISIQADNIKVDSDKIRLYGDGFSLQKKKDISKLWIDFNSLEVNIKSREEDGKNNDKTSGIKDSKFEIEQAELFSRRLIVTTEEKVFDIYSVRTIISNRKGLIQINSDVEAFRSDSIWIKNTKLDGKFDIKEFRFDIGIKSDALGIKYNKISEDTLQIQNPEVKITTFKDELESKFIETIIKAGMVQFEIKTLLENDKNSISIELVKRDGKGFDRRTIPCNDLLTTFNGVSKWMEETSMTGSISASIGIKRVKEKDPSVEVFIENKCRITSIPDSMNVKKIKGSLVRRALIKDISKYVMMAVMTTEDPGFKNHHGFDMMAISNSIRDDIKANKFMRGASTITMQLAKNLWLERKKTISRKIQEAILTIHLEQNLTKDEIMELYLNKVEFAPNLYGIEKASEFYFKSPPSRLTLGQSLFLSLMLPKPTANFFDSKGQVYESHMNLIRTLMKSMRDRNLISEEEYKIGISESIIKGESNTESMTQEEKKLVESIDTQGWE